MKKVAIIGECMIELNGKPFGEMYQTYGGDTLNAATYARRVSSGDTQISYVTAVGTDPLSAGMLERWNLEGIDTSLILKDPKRTIGAYLIQLDDTGERTFMYWRANSPASQLLKHPHFLEVERAITNQHDMVFISGISLAILDENDQQLMLETIEKWRQAGLQVAFDSNYRPALWGNDLSQVRKVYARMYKTTQLALVTFDDETAMWGDTSPEQTILRLTTQHNVKLVVVKIGEDGVLVGGNGFDTPLHVETTKVRNVVDTTSAGDAFNGGFLSGYLAGLDIPECCKRGNKLAGIVIQHKGAIIPAEHINLGKI